MYWGDDIFEEMQRMQEDMDRLFVRSFGRNLLQNPSLGYEGQAGAGRNSRALATKDRSGPPIRMQKCDLCETESAIIANVEIPGADKKDIDLRVNSRSIEIKVGTKSSDEKKDKEKGTYSYSSFAQSFYRSIPLPKEVDGSKAQAEYRNGVLRIEVPKSGKEKVSRIEIK